MKVLHVIPTLGPGGAEAFVTMLALASSESGLKVNIYLTVGIRGERGKYLYNLLRAAGISVTGGEARSAYSLVNIFHLVWIIYKFKPDILHAHLFNAEVLTSFVARVLFFPKSRVFRTLHLTNIVNEKMKRVEMVLDKMFGTSIACGAAVEMAYKAFYHDDHSSRLVTIPNGIKIPNALPAEDIIEFRSMQSIASSCYVVTSVAGFRGVQLSTSQKAHDIILLAFAKFQKIVDDSLLLLIGDGPLIDDARGLARELKIYDKVRFMGSVSNPYPFLAISSVFFMPSRFEGLPIALLEAAVNGLPVVASRIPEIVYLNDGYPWFFSDVDDVDGFVDCLVSAKNCIRSFSDNYKRSVSSRFDIVNCAASYRSYYELLN